MKKPLLFIIAIILLASVLLAGCARQNTNPASSPGINNGSSASPGINNYGGNAPPQL